MCCNVTSGAFAIAPRGADGELGVWFQLEVPIGNAIVDLLASSARLVIEVDGGSVHSAPSRRHRTRCPAKPIHLSEQKRPK
jgi:hypothetical protein